MSSDSESASLSALQTNKSLAEGYYGIALPALGNQMGQINQGLSQGESPLMKQAFESERANLSEGITGQSQAGRRSQLAGSKKQLSGGNMSSMLSTSDIGAQLANALYGSKFQEGQADINQKMNLMSMALGGAGTSGNAALGAAGNQLNAIGYLPNYNSTYANVLGAASAGSSLYGAYQNWAAGQVPGTQPGLGSGGGNPATGLTQ